MDGNSKISKIIKAWVEKSDFSQLQLAEKLGISRFTLNSQLNGVKPVPTKRIAELIKLLNPSEKDLEKLNQILSSTKNLKIDSQGTISTHLNDDGTLTENEKSQTQESNPAARLWEDNQDEFAMFIQWLCEIRLDNTKIKPLLDLYHKAFSNAPPGVWLGDIDIFFVAQQNPMLDRETKAKLNRKIAEEQLEKERLELKVKCFEAEIKKLKRLSNNNKSSKKK